LEPNELDEGVQRARRAIPRLRGRLQELVDLGDQMSVGARFSVADHFAFMGVFFLAKQREHAVGIWKLEDHPDAALIARSMMEGRWQMRWASEDPNNRGERWRDFSILYDWRVLRDKLGAGVEVEPERIRRVESRLPEVEGFLSPRAREARARGGPMPDDPYLRTWTGKSVRDLAEACDGLELYASLYADFSDRHHWSPGGLGQGIQVHGERVHYDASSPTLTAQALSVGFECLLDCSVMVNEHLTLGYDVRLEDIARRMFAENPKPDADAHQ
jgi:hypothetical protein